MSRRTLLLVVAALVVIGAIGAVALMRRDGAQPADADVAPTALVTVSPVRAQSVQDVISVYGTVQADAAGSVTVAAPRAVSVAKVLVRSGQMVSAGQALIEIVDAPGTEMAYRQAADAVTFGQTDLARVQRLYDERLAASDQLTAAKKTLADAQALLAAQRKQGAGQSVQTLRAPQAGVVTTVSAAPGDHVAQDAPLLTLARADGAVVKLGLEPTGKFAVGQAVTLKPVFGGPPIASRITMVGRTADQTTKTLDAIAPLNGAALPIGAAVLGEIVTTSHTGRVVPRASVVFDETGPHVFVVAGGKARRVFVGLGLDQGDAVEIKGELPAGSLVAVEGAYELQDGMAVKVRDR